MFAVLNPGPVLDFRLTFCAKSILISYTFFNPPGTKEFYSLYGSIRVGVIFMGIVVTLVLLLLSHYKLQQKLRDGAQKSSLTKKMHALTRRLRSEPKVGTIRY